MRKLFALIALAAAVFTACEGDNEVNYDNLKIKLSSESVMSFGKEGGNGVITYDFEQLDDATRSNGPQAITNAEWITDVTVNESDNNARN